MAAFLSAFSAGKHQSQSFEEKFGTFDCLFTKTMEVGNTEKWDCVVFKQGKQGRGYGQKTKDKAFDMAVKNWGANLKK